MGDAGGHGDRFLSLLPEGNTHGEEDQEESLCGVRVPGDTSLLFPLGGLSSLS